MGIIQLMHYLENISDEFGFNPKRDRNDIMQMLNKVRDDIIDMKIPNL